MNCHKALRRTRRVHEVEVDEVVDAEFLKLQNNGREVGSENFRVCVLLHLALKALLCVV